MTIYLLLCVAFTPSAVLSLSPASFHALKTTFCNKDAKDAQGKPNTCGKSLAMETYGLTLPGMEHASLSVREHIVVAKDGVVRIKAMPSRPFQYFAYAERGDRLETYQLYNHKSYALASTKPQHPLGHMLASSLKDIDWRDLGETNVAGQKLRKWIKHGPHDIDKDTGANFTTLYASGLFPNVWTFYTDIDEKEPVKLIGSNTFNNKVLQEVIYSNYQILNDSLDVDEAIKSVHDMYKVTPANLELVPNVDDQDAPTICDGVLDDPHICESERNFVGDGMAVDWMPSKAWDNLRSSAQNIIPYFDVPKGSATYTFFHHDGGRRLPQLVKFEYPSGCNVTKSESDLRYCLFIKVNAAMSGITLSAGMKFYDVNDKNKAASLYIDIVIDKHLDRVLRLDVIADGTATVWQLGEGVSLSIVVEIQGRVTDDTDKDTFIAECKISVSFCVKLPVVGTIIDATIYAKLGITAAPQNVITAYGEIGLSASILLAGAGVGLNIKGETLDHLANSWAFVSEVFLTAWVNIGFYSHDWRESWELWHASPVNF
ncbi:hypothetical protein FOL47_009000 [Perkinsus chesapeaki]|uniref:Uncharacterized protein n=1 Tax=Perkinsus chesapeaki TaxID=330153 RepID=A0A7J6MSM5_PERCH|nr:hypothetical protein FOL47_009000 [Perkinsus chesapeaki]